MKIDPLVDRDYFAVSVLEDIQQLYDLLKERPCYVVMDEKRRIIGIVTLNDVPFYDNGRLTDKDFKKPVLSPGCTIAKALRLMKSTENSFLPVYKTTTFVGIISLLSIAEHLLEITTSCRKNTKKN